MDKYVMLNWRKERSIKKKETKRKTENKNWKKEGKAGK